MHDLVAAGAERAVVTRAEDPTLALVDGEVLEIVAPRLEPLDFRGAGDSLMAGLAAGLCQDRGMATALRLGAAAGGINVTRRGLATGRRDDIERLARHIAVRPLHRRPRAVNAD
jgi:1-phosphofructokinase